MRDNNTTASSTRFHPAKPYAMVGAGALASTVWKDGSEFGGWQYRFNVFRLNQNGSVGQKFTPADLKHLVKLTQVLASVLADDGCVSNEEREELFQLAESLDDIIQSDESPR